MRSILWTGRCHSGALPVSISPLWESSRWASDCGDSSVSCEKSDLRRRSATSDSGGAAEGVHQYRLHDRRHDGIPRHPCRRQDDNQPRHVDATVAVSRSDLTLTVECIRRHYCDESSPLSDMLRALRGLASGYSVTAEDTWSSVLLHRPGLSEDCVTPSRLYSTRVERLRSSVVRGPGSVDCIDGLSAIRNRLHRSAQPVKSWMLPD